ncbi:MAG TPA: AarF/ABC1/UbiB kinase family protein [Anaerolineales bacterium]|jgi:predicted unusual protein kinase regulating ubiquinone biosynthesis (AarF/ABC1/UbiB family)|nr:AarF/ABC1/UbiB kinase family protein [Anaerolineales bacterium]
MDRSRFRRINFFFARVLFSVFIWEILFPLIGLKKLSGKTRSRRLRQISRNYHDLAVKLGGVLIKVGQFLSARMDVFPEEITEELAGLQDEVPPETFENIRKLAERELNSPLEEIFAKFEEAPLAAASLGQVHRAQLKPEDQQAFGTEVVVKIQRPEIETIIATDLSALRWVGDIVMRYRPVRKRIDIPSLLAEFTKVLYEEIDYIAEGRNASTFAENFADVPGVRVPEVVWSHTTKRVLTLEDVFAIKITDYQEMDDAGIDRAEVANRLFDTYMRQIFEDGFFHADPHPGNLFVDTNGPDGPWLLTFIDFGMVGHIPPNTRAGLKEFAIGMGTKDANRIISAYRMLNILLPNADLDLIIQAESAMFDRFWGKSMDELRNIPFEEMHDFAKEFRELVYEMPFQVPQDLVFLFRTVAILAGICTGLHPDFNLWTVMAPYTEKMISEEAGTSTWLKEAGLILQTLVALPRKTENVLDRLNRGGLSVQIPAGERQLKQINQTLRRLVYAVIFLAFLTSGTQVYLNRAGWLAYVLLGMAGLALLAAIIPRRPPR